MKLSVNKVELNGFLGQDPMYKDFKSGKTMVSMRIATNEVYKDKTGEKVTNTTWHNVVLWKEPSKEIRDNLKKGALVSITGKLRNGKYTDKNGQVRYITEIVASNIELDNATPKND